MKQVRSLVVSAFKQPPLQGDYDEEEYERVAKRPRASEFIHEEAGVYVCELVCVRVCVVHVLCVCAHMCRYMCECVLCVYCVCELVCMCVHVCACECVHVCMYVCVVCCTGVCKYFSLIKEHSLVEQLTSLPKRRASWGTFSNVYGFSCERNPHVCLQ